MNTSTTSSERSRSGEDGQYQELVRSLRHAAAWPLFTTDADQNGSLYDDFLDELPRNRRQHYVCRACRKFVDRFGGLVTINDEGHASAFLWGRGDVPDFFADAVTALNTRVFKAKVTGVFLNSEGTWGLAENKSPKSPNASGMWHHMHVMVDLSRGDMHKNRGRNTLLTSEQEMAEKFQDFGTLDRGLAEFPIDLVTKAHTLLTTGGLYRSEKCIGVAKWLLDLHESLIKTKHKARRENLVWRAVALAPPGYAHIRSTMIGALLTDLAEDKPFSEIKAAFDSKLNPLQYQRPQAAPTDGQLAAAEVVISKLASAGSLARRLTRLDEILPHAIWIPKTETKIGDGSVFGHLKPQKDSLIDIPTQPMTWDKFNWTVLPTAERVELLVPHHAGNYFAFTTAVNPDAPPILQWDREDMRNPVSWYLYMGGSLASNWGLTAGVFCDVTAITMQPSGWNDAKLAHQGDGAYLVLKGAADRSFARAGLGLFPETLRAEYRAIRSAMEAFSRSKQLEIVEAPACGLALQKASTSWTYTLRVTVKGARVNYRLDRWD